MIAWMILVFLSNLPLASSILILHNLKVKPLFRSFIFNSEIYLWNWQWMMDDKFTKNECLLCICIISLLDPPIIQIEFKISFISNICMNINCAKYTRKLKFNSVVPYQLFSITRYNVKHGHMSLLSFRTNKWCVRKFMEISLWNSWIGQSASRKSKIKNHQQVVKCNRHIKFILKTCAVCWTTDIFENPSIS